VPLSITLIEAFGLYLVRTSALVLSSPILGSGTGFAGYKVALILSVAVALFLSTGAPLAQEPGGIEFGLMCLHEILVGLFLGFVLQAVLIAVRVAGELVGTEMAFNMASIVDPGTGVQTPLVTQVYEVLFFLGLLAVNGHHWLLRALGSSFERAPIGGLRIEGGVVPLLLELFSRMFKAGITFAAPVLVLLLMVSVLIGLLARLVPQINVLEVGFNIRVMVGLLALFLFSPLLAPAMNTLFEQLMGGLDGCLEALEA
jgi:flagellar biosynthetic protein FliR